MSQTFCTKCGGTLTLEHKFCAQCGETNPAFGADAPPSPSDGGAGWDMVLDALRKATRGEFDIGGELGHGGMAAVYLAHDIALDKKVAIKVMAPTLMADTTMVDRFRQEARTVAKLEHQNIVTVHAAKQAGGLHFFVMKYIEGRELGDVLQNGPLPLGVVQSIIYEIGLALSYAHSAAQPVIHRDVKPSNIMLDARGNAVLTDFGIAKLKGGRSHTMHGAAIGTPQYMSPEQCLAQPVSAASDQYSLGMVAYHMLNGEPPYHGDPLTVMRKQVDDPLPPIERLREGPFPGEVRTALERMLAKDAADRFPNVLDGVRALGGHPLPPGDPIKEDIVRLVNTPDFVPPTEVFTTPMSPSPQSAAPPQVSDPSLPTQPMVAPPRDETPSQEQMEAPTAPFQAPSAPSEPPERSTAPAAVATSDAGAYRPSEDLVPGTVAVDSVGTAPATVAVQAEPATVAGRALPVKLIAGVVAALAVVVVIVIMTLGGGGGGGGGEGGSGGTLLALVPSEFGLRVDQSQQLQLAGASGTGIEWVSNDETVASVDASGRVVAIAAGSAEIVARYGGDSAIAVVNVASDDARLTEIALSPSTGQVVVGRTRRFRAEQFDQNGNRLPDEAVDWASANPATATVRADGTVSGVAAGVTQIRASRGGISSTATIRVLAPEPVATGDQGAATPARAIVASVEVRPRTINLAVGQSQRITARALDADGQQLERTVSWRTQDVAIARVTTRGNVTAVGAGETRVLASAQGAEDGARVLVTRPAPVIKPPVAVNTPSDTARRAQPRVEPRDTARAPAVRDTAKPPAPRDRAVPAQPTPVAPTVAPFTGLVAGGSHTCVVDGQGASWCWGRNAEGQVQGGAGERVPRPAARSGAADTIVAGGRHTCALRGGQLSCWGRNNDGQLGSQDRSASTSSVATTRFRMVSLGNEHSCGLTSAGEAFCWGKNDRGQLGDGSTSRRTEPTAVSSDQRFRQVVAGGRHSCGLTRAGEAICWGDNWSGQVGSSMLQHLPSPTGVSGDQRFTQLAAGTEFTCGVATDGTAYCWGKNNAGQLGDGSTRQRTSPSQVGTTGLTSIVVGGEHACGINRQGRAVCWGRGREGQLGTGQADNRREPTPVSGNHRFRVLAAGEKHTCGLTTDGQVLCWGANDNGQLGSGGTQASRVPVAITVRQ